MLESFEAEYDAKELLKGIPPRQLLTEFEQLTGGPVWVLGVDGKPLLSTDHTVLPEACPKIPVSIDFEPVAWICAECDVATLRSVANLFSLVLQSRARYLMAAALHSEVSIADYQNLQNKNRELALSESRYRELAEQLERRVEEQVVVIESRQRQLYQNEKLSSVGKLAAGVAHEINNPMAFVSSNIQSGKRYLGKLEAFRDALFQAPEQARDVWQNARLDKTLQNLREMAVESEQGCARITAIIKNLKAFSNVDNDDWLVVELSELLDQVCSMVACDLPADVQLEQHVEAGISLRCMPGHLSQGIYAILDNSLHALRDVMGTKTITLEAVSDGDHCHIRVTDNGVGIAEEHLSRVFDPFFTTREVGEGAGLGLTLCRDMVQAHHGAIRVESEPLHGTQVTLILPLRTPGGVDE